MTRTFKNFSSTLLLVCTLAALTGCEPLGAPDAAPKPTRLYVSSSAAGTGNQKVDVFDAADAAAPSITRSIQSGNTEGVWVDTESNILIHAGSKAFAASPSPTVKFYANSTTVDSNAAPTSQFTDTLLTNAREITFDDVRKSLYIANQTKNEIRIYDNAPSLTGNVTASRVLTLPDDPWSVFYDRKSDRLFIAFDTGSDSIYIYNNPQLKNGNAAPDKVLRLKTTYNTNAQRRLHNAWYSNKLDVLYVTDVGNGSPDSADGSVYVVEQLATVLATATTAAPVTPTRTITGLATLLKNPTDVDVDDRDGREDIYISEKAGAKILVFKFGATGNAAPAKTFPHPSPEDIFLDIFTP
ncbi:MAG: hypothetical protein IAF08_17060 [Rhizobacter sp.]|nr:hypothetical protein [Chlorobiales bacterium]